MKASLSKKPAETFIYEHTDIIVFLCTINYRERIELKFLNMIDNTFNKIIVGGT